MMTWQASVVRPYRAQKCGQLRGREADSRQLDGDGGSLEAGQRGQQQGAGRRVTGNKHSNRDRSMTHLQGECSCRRAGSVSRFNVGVVLVLSVTRYDLGILSTRRQDYSIDMENDLKMTVSIWEKTVSMWKTTLR